MTPEASIIYNWNDIAICLFVFRMCYKDIDNTLLFNWCLLKAMKCINYNMILYYEHKLQVNRIKHIKVTIYLSGSAD